MNKIEEEKLSQLLKDMKRFGTLNPEDVPTLVKLVESLQASEKLAWLQLDEMEKMYDYVRF